MKLINKELEKVFKQYPLYSQDGKGKEAVILCKFFNPVGVGSWYVLEAEKQEDNDYLFFGYIELLDKEYGYFLLSELEKIELPVKILDKTITKTGLERDFYYDYGMFSLSEVLKD